VLTGLWAYAGDQARQANFGGDNYAPIFFGGAPAPAPSLHQLPSGIPDFSGRAADIAEIEHLAVSCSNGPRIINVFGAPGIGKTALTTHVAHRLAGRLDEIQLYAELGEVNGQAATSTQVLQRFVAALDPATTGIPVGAQELPTRYRSLLSGRRCLVVLDNAQSADQIADLIPGTASSVVLVTSRASLSAVEGVVPYHLNLMSPRESLALLASVSLRAWPGDRPPDAAHALINECGRLPLALRIVGAILKKKPHWTLEKVAADLAGEKTKLAMLTAGQLDVRSSFEVSYRQLSSDEAQAFRLFSLLPLAQFKVRHAASFLQQTERHAEERIETLVDAQLLETDDGRYFRFHDLLRLYAQERSQAADDDPGGVRAARFLQELTSEFMQAYSRCLREDTWTLPRRDWPSDDWTLEQHDWPLDQQTQAAPDVLYVPARLVADGEPGRLAGSWHDLLAQHGRVLVAGAGGTGKTVLANRICYEIAVSPAGSAQPYDVAFAVPLRQRGDHDQDLETLIADAVRSRYGLDLARETLGILLRDWRTVVIFDGFDEMPPSSRGQAARDITAFCDCHPSAKVIVTSRPGPLGTSFKAAGFWLYEVAPLIDTDVASYVERWGQLRRGSPRGLAPLLEAVSSSKVRQDWLSTPLLITQLLTTYDRTGVVPQGEIELYDMMYAVLFESRESRRGIQRGETSPQELGRLVLYLTYELKARAGVLGVADSEFRLILRAYRHSVGYKTDAMLAATLAALDVPIRHAPEEAAGGEPRWSVTRDPFSEYLAARWVLDSDEFGDITTRLMTMIEAGDFAAGGQFVLQLAARLDRNIERRITAYLHGAMNDDPQQLPGNTRAAIVQMLTGLNS
jgi:Cdc6-like AAA superfamily ATPase